MPDTHDLKKVAVAFVSGIGKGNVNPDDLAEDLTAWSVNSGICTKEVYLGKLRMIFDMFVEPLEMTIDTVTAEDSRVAIQARSRGVVFTGDIYTNTYMFLIEFNEQAQIRHVREYYDQRMTAAVLYPARDKWIERT